MTIRVEELNGTNCKTYLLTSGKHCALVDPVREQVEDYRALLAERALVLALVLETHMHADHLMLDREAKRRLGVPVVMHRFSPSPLADRHVVDGDVLALGSDQIKVLHTPGHTPDSVCYLLEGAVLTGDTLLIGGSGRTDFPGGDSGAQYDAVTEKLFALPEHTVVYPAHDYNGHTSSTIGAEKRNNPRFSVPDRGAYIALMGSLGLPLPERIQQALQVNQSGFEPSEVSFPLITEAARAAPVAPSELAARLRERDPPLVLDVREPEEFVGDLGHIQGALLVPLDLLQLRLPKLAGYAERDVVVVCRAGARSATACAMLERAGFGRAQNLEGGMLAWQERALPVQR